MKGELFKRTKELGYKGRHAKKLLDFWGDWWWRDESEEDEDEEEEVEEEIEEFEPPTSAGKESSSKPSPPSDAVEYDGKIAEKDAAEEEKK